MSKINELIDNIDFIEGFHRTDIERIMKEYAEFYARKSLKQASKEASANFECIGAVLGAENVNPYVEESSITGINLPEHE